MTSLLGIAGMPGHFELLIIAVVFGIPIVAAVIVIFLVTNKKRQAPAANNLTPCPDCNGAVSVRAQTCPQCGAPLKPLA